MASENDNVHEELNPEDLKTSEDELFGDKKPTDDAGVPDEEKPPTAETDKPVEEPNKEDAGLSTTEDTPQEKSPEDLIGELRLEISEKEFERRLAQSELDSYKASQQAQATQETLPKTKTVPLENLSPQDFMQEEYLPDEAGMKGTPSHVAWQNYQREVTERNYAEQVKRGKAQTVGEQITSNYDSFVKSIDGDKKKLAVVDEAVKLLSSTDPNEFIGYDKLYQIGLLLRNELPDKTKETVKQITDHKNRLAEQPPAPFDTANQREEELSTEKELSKQEDEVLDDMLGKVNEPFLN